MTSKLSSRSSDDPEEVMHVATILNVAQFIAKVASLTLLVFQTQIFNVLPYLYKLILG